ncbi:GntR family transcriptional regulator [bacterium]|nr:GntR family transcriptional regulator [bacterium]
MIPIHVNPSSGVPIYMQVMNQIRSLIVSTALKTNDKLPSVRELAEFLQVNPMTISKAYSILELEKTVYRLHGKGIYVSSSTNILKKKERLAMLQNHVKHIVYEAMRLDISVEETTNMLREIFKKLNEKQEEK